MNYDQITTSNEVFDTLEHIAAFTGNQRQALVEAALHHPLFKRVCCAALDPFVTYGVKAIADVDVNKPGREFTVSDWKLLNELATRELTGNAALDAIRIHSDQLSGKSATLLKRIITRDLRANFSSTAVNKAQPGTIFTFEVMLAHKYDGKSKFPVMVEEKLDGVRVLAIYKNGKVGFYSRTGKEFFNYDHIGRQLLQLTHGLISNSSFVFDGEVTDGSFNNTVGGARRTDGASKTAIFNVFEFMPGDSFEKGDQRTHAERRHILESLFLLRRPERPEHTANLQLVASSIARNHEEVIELYNKARAEGKEGVIVKSPNGMYECKRSKAWLKMKAQESADIPITGFFEGEGKYVGMLGGFIGNFNGVEVRVGSGLSDDDRVDFWGRREQIRGDLMEVEYHEVTPDGSLRHPRFARFRDDKPHSDGPGV